MSLESSLFRPCFECFALTLGSNRKASTVPHRRTHVLGYDHCVHVGVGKSTSSFFGVVEIERRVDLTSERSVGSFDTLTAKGSRARRTQEGRNVERRESHGIPSRQTCTKLNCTAEVCEDGSLCLQPPCGSGFDEGREAAGHSPATFLASSSSTEVLRNNLCASYSASSNRNVVSAGSRFQATIHRDAAWHPVGPVHSQQYLSNLCDAPTLDTSSPSIFARSQAPESGLQEVPPLPSATRTLTSFPRCCGTRFASPFSHETRSFHSAVKSSTVSATTWQCATAQATAVADTTRWPMSFTKQASLPKKLPTPPSPTDSHNDEASTAPPTCGSHRREDSIPDAWSFAVASRASRHCRPEFFSVLAFRREGGRRKGGRRRE